MENNYNEQNLELFLKDLEKEYNPPTNHWVENQILSMMTNSDIWIIIKDKENELNFWQKNKKEYIKKYRWTNRKIAEMLFDDKINQTKKELRKWQFIFGERTWSSVFKQVNIEKYKQNIPLIDVMQLYGIKVKNIRYNIKCPLPNHKDWTPSFHIYWNNFKCFGCHSWWTQIDFIKYMENIDNKEATKKFIEIWKKYFNE